MQDGAAQRRMSRALAALFMLFVLFASFGLAGCSILTEALEDVVETMGSDEEDETGEESDSDTDTSSGTGSSSDTQIVSHGGYSLEVPAEWVVSSEENSYGTVTYTILTSEEDYYAYFVFQPGVTLVDSGITSAEELVSLYADGLGIDTSGFEQTITDEGALIYRSVYEDPDYPNLGYAEVIISGDSYAVISTACPEETFDEHDAEMTEVLDSLTIEDPEAPIFSSST